MKYKSLSILLLCSIGVVGQTTNPTSTRFTNGLIPPSRTTAPYLSPGSLWHDVVANAMKWYNGSQWVTVGSSGGITTETDPTVPANVKAITATNISNWNSAFGWGNHASVGYYLASNPNGYTSNTGTVTALSAVNGIGQTWSIQTPNTSPVISLALTKTAVGLANVDNTSDVNKPLSTAQQAYIDARITQIVEITGTTQNAVAGTIYIPHSSSRTVITLPATLTVGQLFQIVGEGTGGFRIAQNASQSIVGVGTNTTVGTAGYMESTNANCTITLRVTNTNKLTITSSQGTFTTN